MSRIWERRLHMLRGRLLAYVEPRDLWIGVYVAEDYVYVCLLPFVVLRWERSWSWQYTRCRPISDRR